MTSPSSRVPITLPLHILSQHFDGDVTRIFCFSDQLWERNNTIPMASTHLLWLPASSYKTFGRWHLTRQPMNLSPYLVALMIFCVLASRTRPPEEDNCWLSGLGVYQKFTFTNLYLSSTSHSRYHHHHHHFPHLCIRPELFASEWEVSVSQISSLTTTMISTVENFMLHSNELLHPRRILPWLPFCPLSLLPSITWMRQH